MKGIYWSCHAFVCYVPKESHRHLLYEKGYRTMNNTLPMSFRALFVFTNTFLTQIAPLILDLFVVRYICDVSPL